jgi:prevent-host-death family protein
MAARQRRSSVVTTSQARATLCRLVDQTATSHEPVLITGKRSSAVLLSEEDWRAIQETLYLLSIRRMRESIRDGMNTAVTSCAAKLDW